MGKVATEQTLLEAVHFLKVIARGNVIPDLTSWSQLVYLSKAGKAKTILSVGDIIADDYTVGNTVYKNLWVVLGFREVELEDGSVYPDVPIVKMWYSNHENVIFDPKEQEVATEETALADTHYVGVDAAEKYSVIPLNVGDPVPYENYTSIYHSSWADARPAQYGLNNWKLSWARQYLNHKGNKFAAKQHPFDMLPANAENINGFMTYLPEGMLGVLHPIKRVTKQCAYMGGGTDVTYDTFWLLSPSEMNIFDGNASADDGEPFEFYKQLLGVNPDRADGKWPRATTDTNGSKAGLLKTYAVNTITAPQYCWLRSCNIGNNHEWVVNSSGGVNSGNPCNSGRVSPACALI